jgi:hypothetical protein
LLKKLIKFREKFLHKRLFHKKVAFIYPTWTKMHIRCLSMAFTAKKLHQLDDFYAKKRQKMSNMAPKKRDFSPYFRHIMKKARKIAVFTKNPVLSL